MTKQNKIFANIDSESRTSAERSRSVQNPESIIQNLSGNWLLKACIFATGLSGIVAEYVMSTLASYLLGNSVLQWTLTISIMLFAMGVGSRFSKFVDDALLDAFVFTELLLSVLCAISATTIYFLSAYMNPITPLIYTLSFAIGLLIGLEIPLATRLNDYFEDLKINISSVMEKDYYGALLGGLLFAFVALPYLGLTYTPIILGAVNFT
ncbi:MAG: spermidine synthase, partial [Calditrichaeota bacterium]|nr:spermidine synthase [Calditrichota bacterium]